MTSSRAPGRLALLGVLLLACGGRTAMDLRDDGARDTSTGGARAGGGSGGAPAAGGGGSSGGSGGNAGTNACVAASSCGCDASGKTQSPATTIAAYRDAASLDARFTLDASGLAGAPKQLYVGRSQSGGVATSQILQLGQLGISRTLPLETIDGAVQAELDSCTTLAWDARTLLLRWLVPLDLVENHSDLSIGREDSGHLGAMASVQDVSVLPPFCGEGIGCDLP